MTRAVEQHKSGQAWFADQLQISLLVSKTETQQATEKSSPDVACATSKAPGALAQTVGWAVRHPASSALFRARHAVRQVNFSRPEARSEIRTTRTRSGMMLETTPSTAIGLGSGVVAAKALMRHHPQREARGKPSFMRSIGLCIRLFGWRRLLSWA
jgi:hypothetical protein